MDFCCSAASLRSRSAFSRAKYSSSVCVGFDMQPPQESEGALHHRVQLRLRRRADQLIRDLAVLEEEQGGDAHHVVLLRDILMRVDVELADLQLALVFGGELVDERRDGAAGPAPGGPEIDQDGLGGGQDLALEVFVGKGRHVRARHQNLTLWGIPEICRPPDRPSITMRTRLVQAARGRMTE